MASARLPDYSAWARSNLGPRFNYSFGCVLEEAVEVDETELPFILAAALRAHADAEPDAEDDGAAERAEYDEAAEHHAEAAEPEPEPERPPNAGAGIARPEPAVPDARAIADAYLADGRIGREMLAREASAREELDDDGDGIDYAAEERRLNSVEAMLMGVRIADMPPTCPTCKRSCSCPV